MKERVVVPYEVWQAKSNRRPERIRIWRKEPALVYDLLARKRRKAAPKTRHYGDDIA
jgi:hypothetical protein